MRGDARRCGMEAYSPPLSRKAFSVASLRLSPACGTPAISFGSPSTGPASRAPAEEKSTSASSGGDVFERLGKISLGTADAPDDAEAAALCARRHGPARGAASSARRHPLDSAVGAVSCV